MEDRSKRVVSCAQMKELEKAADEAGLSYYQMMENAGMCSAAIVIGCAPGLMKGGKGIVLCGKGNNGGDGSVVARIIAGYGAKALVCLVEGEPVTPDAIRNRKLLDDMGNVTVTEELPSAEELDDADIIVDGIYGTGFYGAMKERAGELVDRVNGSGTKVLSLDIPSGLAGDDEGPEAAGGKHIKADYTVTFHSFKPIHKNPAAAESMGQISVADIGIDEVLKK